MANAQTAFAERSGSSLKARGAHKRYFFAKLRIVAINTLSGGLSTKVTLLSKGQPAFGKPALSQRAFNEVSLSESF